MVQSFETQLVPVMMKDRVARLIKDAMIAGDLKPGDRIVELKLAKQLGLGTTSIREALYDLERQGFVTRIANKGAYVTTLSKEDTRQVYAVRVELEGLAVQLVTQNIQPQDIDLLQANIDGMEKFAREGNLIQFYESDLEFHRNLWTLSRNRYILQFLESVVAPQFAFYVMRVRRNPEQLLRGTESHRTILKAIIEKSPEEAREVVANTLRYYLDHESEFLVQNGAESSSGEDRTE